MELVTLRQENAFVQEKCEPSGKREELHDVYIDAIENVRVDSLSCLLATTLIKQSVKCVVLRVILKNSNQYHV